MVADATNPGVTGDAPISGDAQAEPWNMLADATPPPSTDGWVFSSELSDQRLAEIQGLLGLQGLNSNGSRAEATHDGDADAAFARMVAANPGATVYGTGRTEATDDDADAAFARMIAANPGATVIGGGARVTDDDAGSAFARMVAANPAATVYGTSRTEATDDDADAAFARMSAANPGATVIGGGVQARANDTDAVVARVLAENPDTVVIRGPAAGGMLPRAPAGTAGGWRFSPDLSPDRLAELQALVGMNGTADAADDDEAQRAAADAAFEQMLVETPGAVEVAPGVFAQVQDSGRAQQ